MADALASGLVSTILGNLNSLVLEEFSSFCGLKADLVKLQSNLSMIQAVLNDAEEKQWKSEAIKNWLRKLKNAAYDADDLLDEFAIEAQARQQQRALTNRVRSFVSLDHNPLVFRSKMARRLKDVRKIIDGIADERNKFQLIERVGDLEGVRPDWRLTGSKVNEPDIYGRDREKEGLINMLLANSDNLSVYAIWGMGGLGKTALAQLIYNDGRLEEHFDLRIWVCVSTGFTLKKLISAIIESTERSNCTIQELDPLQRELEGKLRGKKFLLVLDDVWDDFKKWIELKDVLMAGAKGSGVMVTTRIETVALKMDSVFVQAIDRLSEDDSWLLFKRYAFGTRRGDECASLEPIGKAIVKKCGGVPLAVKALGNLMRLKKNKTQWLSMLHSEIWNFWDAESEISSALMLSYINLPPNLKQCFAICSIFPKDFLMEKEHLIALWMANGFIPHKGQMDLYDLGNEIFDELVGRSFFQDVKADDLGNISCKMHDIMHDLAQSIMSSESCLIEGNNKKEILGTVRHVALYDTSDALYDIKLDEAKSLRSFLSCGYNYLSDIHLSFLARQKHLRTLDLSSVSLYKFPKSIANLKHLRYLDVSGSDIKKLPESISTIQQLETLNLRYCSALRMLPKGMKHLKNLLYLDITRCSSLRCMPAGMGQLTRLRKLSKFIVGRNDGCSIGELGSLIYLQGELCINKLENVAGSTDAKSANLRGKEHLQSLKLSWDKEANINGDSSEEVLCGLEPHSNLKELKVWGYGGSSFPSWMMNLQLPNLVEISLQHCVKCEHLPPFGKLKFLRGLRLCGLNAVKSVGSDLYGDGETSFPSLERLRLKGMSSLEEWACMTGRETFPCLRELEVRYCPVLFEIPVIPSVKELQIKCCSVTALRSALNFTFSVKSLRIEGFDGLTHLPDGLLQNYRVLESLGIFYMSGLKSLSNQLDNLSALKSLYLRGCVELESLSEGLHNLNSLESLTIWHCDALISFPINGLRGLSSLRHLVVKSCEKFASLSDGVRYLTALEDLILDTCPMLNTLPEDMQHLTSLRSLLIMNCDGLSSLPNQIGDLSSLSQLRLFNNSNLMSLPEGLQSLSVLEINDCPNLKRRYEKERGEDWAKIAHIPTIRMDDELIQSLELEA